MIVKKQFCPKPYSFKILSTFFLILNLRLIKQYYLRYLLVPFLVLGNWFNKVKLQLWLFFQGLIQANPSYLTLTCGSWYSVASNYQKLGPFSARCFIFQLFIIEKKMLILKICLLCHYFHYFQQYSWRWSFCYTPRLCLFF